MWGWSSGDGDKWSVPGYVYLGGGANRTLSGVMERRIRDNSGYLSLVDGGATC